MTTHTTPPSPQSLPSTQSDIHSRKTPFTPRPYSHHLPPPPSPALSSHSLPYSRNSSDLSSHSVAPSSELLLPLSKRPCLKVGANPDAISASQPSPDPPCSPHPRPLAIAHPLTSLSTSQDSDIDVREDEDGDSDAGNSDSDFDSDMDIESGDDIFNDWDAMEINVNANVVEKEAKRLSEVIQACIDGKMSSGSIENVLKAKPLDCKCSYQSIKRWMKRRLGIEPVQPFNAPNWPHGPRPYHPR